MSLDPLAKLKLARLQAELSVAHQRTPRRRAAVAEFRSARAIAPLRNKFVKNTLRENFASQRMSGTASAMADERHSRGSIETDGTRPFRASGPLTY